MAHHSILIIQLIIRACFLRTCQKAVHLVLVQIDQTVITLIFLIIYIVDTTITT